MQRTVFFISDGTAITTETVGHSLLTQFPDQQFERVRLPFVSNLEKAEEAVLQIQQARERDGVDPVVLMSIIDDTTRRRIAAASSITLDLFADFLDSLESALGVKRQSTVGQAHGMADVEKYNDRMEATNYTLAHDDGMSNTYDNADLILVGVSRSGKTPTCLYMALHFGVKAANYPLTPDDLDSTRLPRSLARHKRKIVGLTIDPDRLAQIRENRRPGSNYASLRQCHREVDAAETMLRSAGIDVVHTTHSSIEEIASRILVSLGLQREMF